MMHGSSDRYAVVDPRGVPKIPEGMTFGEIDLIIPAIRKARGFAGEHGGVRYGVPLAGGYELSFRFEHSTEDEVR